MNKASKNGLPIIIVTKEIVESIRKNVMDAKHNFIAIYSNDANGFIIETKDDKLSIPDKEYWRLKEFCTIIK